ncbi:hypothetical protein [Reichenbachiella agariperforans]|uniref:Uncharacterized protein n=1 Tax=Reichenbachiella agariperforans TaxID=156994 RepID=A0A1M6Q2L9_REIAG|nr:hypothetical protein [Reichenbachiella agariperforans]MBU2914198.1 hypothetical protein [Reichenbachiella agariperforans]SHK14450.1 hypothetical protein SAMN04488028_103147 [Reichenbachiella agariperforans]
MALRFKNGEEYYNKIYTVFNLTVAITLLPFGYLVLEKHSGNLGVMSLGSWQLWAVSLPAIATLAYLTWRTQQVHQKEKEIAKEQSTLRAKLSAYYATLYKRFWIFAGINMGSTIMLYITGSGLFIMTYVGSMILLSLSRPTLNLIIEELKLNPEEEKIIVNKEEIV